MSKPGANNCGNHKLKLLEHVWFSMGDTFHFYFFGALIRLG